MASNRPFLVLIGWVVLSILLGLGAANLTFRGDYRVYFEPDNPHFQTFEKMQSVFSKSESVSFLVVPQTGTVFNKDTLNLILELTDMAWQTPMSSRAQSIANYQYTYSEEDDLIVENLIQFPDLSEDDIASIRDVSLSSNELNNRLVSANGEMAVVDVTVNLPEGDQTANTAEIAAFARDLREKILAKYPGHDMYLSGIVMMNTAFAEEAEKDARTLIPLMFLMIAVMIVILTRSFVASIATMLVVFLSVIITMGFAGHLGFFLSTATVNVPTMVTTLAVADCIHIIVSIRQGMQRGLSRQEAIDHSMKLNTRPIIITSVTTAIGFLTLNFSEVPIMGDLGNLTAFGVMVACILALTLVPAMFNLCRVSFKVVETQQSDHFATLGNWVVNRYKRILPYSLIAFAVFTVYLFNNQLNDIVVKYFNENSDFRQGVNIQEEKMGGLSNIDFVIGTDYTSGLNDPVVLAHIDSFTTWLRMQPEVDHVFSISDTFKRLNKNMHGDDETYYRLPESQDLAAQYLLLYEMSLPYGLDINNLVDIDKSSTRIIVTLQNLGSKEFTGFEKKAKEWFAKLDSPASISAASPPLMFAHIGETNMNSMVWGSTVSLVLISLLLVFALKSWRLGAISLLPNLLPAVIGFGIWGMMSGNINLGLSVVLSMTMGIIVDDTVHFLSKYNAARSDNKSVEESVIYAFNTVGMALLTTTIVLAVGFGVLTLSSFSLNADMGLMTVIIIGVALVVDILFLPAFLLWLDKNASKEDATYAK